MFQTTNQFMCFTTIEESSLSLPKMMARYMLLVGMVIPLANSWVWTKEHLILMKQFASFSYSQTFRRNTGFMPKTSSGFK